MGRSESKTFVWRWLVARLAALPAGDPMGQVTISKDRLGELARCAIAMSIPGSPEAISTNDLLIGRAA